MIQHIFANFVFFFMYCNLLSLLKEYSSEVLYLYNSGVSTSGLSRDLLNYKTKKNFVKILYNYLFQKNPLLPFKGSLRNIEGFILYCLIRKFKIKNILDIGTGNGFSSFICAHALKNNNEEVRGGSIISVDIFDRNKEHNLSQIFKKHNIIKYVNFVVGDSLEVLDRHEFQYKKFELVIIDGQHTYDHVIKELELVQTCLSSSSILFFDDIFQRSSGKSVHDAMLELNNKLNGIVEKIDENFYKIFNFFEDEQDIERQKKKWIKYNSYKKDSNPRHKSALLFLDL